MSDPTVLFEKRDSVALITLNRPSRLNAMDQPMLRQMMSTCDAIEDDDDVRAVVLTGAGSAFCAGFDLRAQSGSPPVGRSEWEPVLRTDFDAVMRFWHLSKPTIAAVHGPALAGGCELAMACDVTISASNGRFGEPELRFGAGIVVMLMPWLVGPKIAKEIFLLGIDDIPASEALRIGMINRVVDDDELLDEALRLARQMAVIDPMVVRRTKAAVNETMRIMGLDAALEAALSTDIDIEGEGSRDKAEFMRHLREGGLKAALAWREARFDV